ncbi:MAG: DUF4397 domain-containing protein [Streptosporangiaceae bacterium]|jgi:hypothetical protein
MKIKRLVRWAILLIAVPALLLGIPKAASASTASSGTGWVRLAHLSPNTPAVDVYLYSFGDTSAEQVLHHVAYGDVSSYEAIAAGDYTVAMRAAGAAATTKPVLSASLTVVPGGAYTVAGLGPESGLRLQVLNDQLTTPPGKVLVRVIQASLQQHEVTVTWNGKPEVTNLTFGSVSSYQAVSPATATLHVAGESESANSTITLAAGTVHTIVVLDGSKGLVLDNFLDAAGSTDAPEGGAATGFGGTAPRVPSPLPWLYLIGAGLLLALAGGLGVRLRPSPRGRHAAG